ncbi:MAG: hypothetical protein AAB372_02370 [Patescibacteria group bacterium]
MAKENEEEQIEEGAESEAVGLKKEEGGPEMEKDWEKVDAIVNAAKKAYEEGTPFPDVISTIIETLTALQNETNDKLGGLGVGGPEMDLPEDSGEQGEPSAEEEE